MHNPSWRYWAVCFFWLGATCPVWGSPPEAAPPAPAEEAGSLTWEHSQLHFNLPSVISGRVSSDMFIGNVTLCYFWTERNQAAEGQLQQLNEFGERHRWLGVRLVGFCVDPELSSVQLLFQAHAWPFACARVSSRLLMQPGSPVKGLPTLLILSPGGLIQGEYAGLLSMEKIEKEILDRLR